MNILHINTADTKGGAAKIAYSLENELKKRGHNSVLLVSRKYSDGQDVKLIRPDNGLRKRFLRKIAYWLANDLDFYPSNHVLNMPEFKNADVVHCHNLHTNYFNLGTLIKISAVKPVIWTFHDMWPITAHCAHAFDGPLKKNGFFACPSLEIYPPIAWHNEKYLENRKAKIYRNSNFHIVTPSKWLADKVARSLLKEKSLTVIYNGIDTAAFRPAPKTERRARLNLPQDKKIVLIVAKGGQANPWKGGDYAEEMIKSYADNPKILFIGLGGETDKSSGNARNIRYTSDQKKLAEYYSAADILLYPSIADNCPLVVLEAQACGLPVVSFETGGIPELIEHKKTGYIAEYKNINDLGAGLDYISDMPQNEKTAMGEYAAARAARNFSLDLMTEKYLGLYREIITGK